MRDRERAKRRGNKFAAEGFSLSGSVKSASSLLYLYSSNAHDHDHPPRLCEPKRLRGRCSRRRSSAAAAGSSGSSSPAAAAHGGVNGRGSGGGTARPALSDQDVRSFFFRVLSLEAELLPFLLDGPALSVERKAGERWRDAVLSLETWATTTKTDEIKRLTFFPLSLSLLLPSPLFRY